VSGSSAPERDWYAPARFYVSGYPAGYTSSLRDHPNLVRALRRIVRKLAPRRALEVGPGDRSLIAGCRRRVYLDVSPPFLARLRGRRVAGDVAALPFRAKSFDLVVACDVLCHVPPRRRARAIDALVRAGERVLLVLGGGASDIARSAVHPAAVERRLRRAGLSVERCDIRAEDRAGPYRISVFFAEAKVR
jgi:hypothetical protein